jgi:hypothetical protein
MSLLLSRGLTGQLEGDRPSFPRHVLLLGVSDAIGLAVEKAARRYHGRRRSKLIMNEAVTESFPSHEAAFRWLQNSSYTWHLLPLPVPLNAASISTRRHLFFVVRETSWLCGLAMFMSISLDMD